MLLVSLFQLVLGRSDVDLSERAEVFLSSMPTASIYESAGDEADVRGISMDIAKDIVRRVMDAAAKRDVLQSASVSTRAKAGHGQCMETPRVAPEYAQSEHMTYKRGVPSSRARRIRDDFLGCNRTSAEERVVDLLSISRPIRLRACDARVVAVYSPLETTNVLQEMPGVRQKRHSSCTAHKPSTDTSRVRSTNHDENHWSPQQISLAARPPVAVAKVEAGAAEVEGVGVPGWFGETWVNVAPQLQVRPPQAVTLPRRPATPYVSTASAASARPSSAPRPNPLSLSSVTRPSSARPGKREMGGRPVHLGRPTPRVGLSQQDVFSMLLKRTDIAAEEARATAAKRAAIRTAAHRRWVRHAEQTVLADLRRKDEQERHRLASLFGLPLQALQRPLQPSEQAGHRQITVSAQ